MKPSPRSARSGAAKKPRVVIDTNVVVSGILASQGYPSRIVDAWVKGRLFAPIISRPLVAEIREVLGRPKFRSRLLKHAKSVRLVLGILINRAEMVTPSQKRLGIFSDSKDHFLLELAVSAKAGAIVTGDTGIIGHLRYRDIVFQTPEQFCKAMGLGSGLT